MQKTPRNLITDIPPERLNIFCAVSLCVFWAALMFSKALASISLGAAVLLWAAWHFRMKTWRPATEPKFLFFLGLLLAWNALTYFWSEAPAQSLNGIVKVAQNLFLFILTTDAFASRKSLKAWEKVFLAVYLAVMLDGWFQYFTAKDFIRHYAIEHSGAGSRVNACFKTYGLFANFLITTLPFLFGLFLYNLREKKSRFWIAGTLAVFAGSIALLFLTRSRGAMLAFLAGVFAVLIYRRNFKLLLISVVLLALSISVLPKQMVIHLDIERKEQSLVERFYLWDRALNVIKAKPLTGTGVNTYAVAHQKYDKTQNWRVRNYYAHNGYLQTAAETGIPGLFLLLLFLAYYFKKTFEVLGAMVRHGDKGLIYLLSGLTVGLFNFLFLSLGDTVMHNSPSIKLFWFLLGIHAAYLQIAKNKLEASA